MVEAVNEFLVQYLAAEWAKRVRFGRYREASDQGRVCLIGFDYLFLHTMFAVRFKTETGILVGGSSARCSIFPLPEVEAAPRSLHQGDRLSARGLSPLSFRLWNANQFLPR